MRISLVMIGKTRRPELQLVIDDYVKRIGRSATVDITELRETGAALKKFTFDCQGPLVLLDDRGKSLDSKSFAKWIGEQRDRSIRQLTFVCGGAEGYPEEFLQQPHQKMSLSPMTYSHELARVMLTEQLYRAFAILAGSAYPK